MSCNKEKLKAAVRAYDIRGIDLNSADARFFAIAIVQSFNGLFDKVIIGMDNRVNSIELVNGLLNVFYHYKITVKNLGVAPTPQLYYASLIEEGTLGIMVTASHNPQEYNGFKTILNGRIIEKQDLLAAIDACIDIEDTVEQQDSYADYLIDVGNLHMVENNSKIKILWDCNSGATADIVNRIVQTLPNVNHVINTDKYITTQPDPTIDANIDRIKTAVKKYDVAICFDGDGDRIILITKNGTVLRGDKILLILAQWMQLGPDNTVVVDIKTSPSIIRRLESLGVRVIMEKTGHAFIKHRMLETGAVLGGEVSGHIFFRFNHHPYDDALLAACYLLKPLLEIPGYLKTFLNSLEKTFAAYDMRIHCESDKQVQVIEYLIQQLQSLGESFSMLDGIRYESEDGWWLVRASNTETALIVCIEAVCLDKYTTYKNYLRSILNLFEVDSHILS